jgi:hypothetical protein
MYMARVIEFYNRSHLRATVDSPHQEQRGKVIPFVSRHEQSTEIVYEADEVLASPSAPWLDSWFDESIHARSPGNIIFQISGSCMTAGSSDQGTEI